MYFENIDSIEKAKKVFRELSKKLHPDHGGNSEQFKNMKNEYDNFLKFFVGEKFKKYNEHYNTNYDFSSQVNDITKVLKTIIDFNITIEIIGKWIYARDSFHCKDTLKDLGFWFSSKHKAWVFSGSEKNKKSVTRLGIDSIREYHGSNLLKEKKDNLKLS